MLALALVVISCKKPGEEEADEPCLENNTMELTLKNTGTIPLRVVMATQLTPQFQGIDPVLTLDLAPGQTVQRVVPAARYYSVWWRDCNTTCTKVLSYAKDYESCNAYTEERGI